MWTSEHILTRGIISQITNTCGITLLRITLLHSITRTISQAKNMCITIHVCHIYWKLMLQLHDYKLIHILVLKKKTLLQNKLENEI